MSGTPQTPYPDTTTTDEEFKRLQEMAARTRRMEAYLLALLAHGEDDEGGRDGAQEVSGTTP